MATEQQSSSTDGECLLQQVAERGAASTPLVGILDTLPPEGSTPLARKRWLQEYGHEDVCPVAACALAVGALLNVYATGKPDAVLEMLAPDCPFASRLKQE